MIRGMCVKIPKHASNDGVNESSVFDGQQNRRRSSISMRQEQSTDALPSVSARLLPELSLTCDN